MQRCNYKDYDDIEKLEEKVKVQCKKCRYFNMFKEPSLFASNYFKVTYMCKFFGIKNEKDYEKKEMGCC